MPTVVADLHRIELKGVNAYLWAGPGGPTLIDTGFPWTVELLLAELASLGVQPGDLRRILITHADLDHVGGLRRLTAQSQAPVCCHAAEAALVRNEHGKRPHPSLAGYLVFPFFELLRRHYQPGCDHVQELVVEGHVTPEGFTILHTPGHSPGHMALLHKERGVLIAGDALNNRRSKLAAPPAIATPKLAAARESVVKLGKLNYEVACFGHGPPLLTGASAAVAALG